MVADAGSEVLVGFTNITGTTVYIGKLRNNQRSQARRDNILNHFFIVFIIIFTLHFFNLTSFTLLCSFFVSILYFTHSSFKLVREENTPSGRDVIAFELKSLFNIQ